MTDSSSNPYDQVPYASYPYPQASPDRLATIATLMGLNPPPLAHARVLELGCCSGGHLIPLAARFPNSQFVGIDNSQLQVDHARQIIATLNLPNIRIEHHNILHLPDLGQFDYIISHGVFSWVPPDVQNHILAISVKNLSPNGIAYISYNIFPGWRIRGIIRDMLLYHTRDLHNADDRIRHARALIDALAQSIPAKISPQGDFFRRELNQLRHKNDDYLFHEHLEDHNIPMYFHQFIERTALHGLSFVAEANFSVMTTTGLKPATAKRLRSLARNRIDFEQYFDFLHNRMFRQSLLCHQNQPLSTEPLPQALFNLCVASRLKPENPTLDIHSTEVALFRTTKSIAKTAQPLMKAALLHLSEIWPHSAPFPELLAAAHSRLDKNASLDAAHTATPDATRAPAHDDDNALHLAEALLHCYAAGQIEVTAHPSPFTLSISDRPLAFPLARLQAKTLDRVTTMRHEVFTLNPLQRTLLPLLDSTRDRPALLDHLTTLVSTGALTLRASGRLIEAPTPIRLALESPLTSALTQLARAALLLA